MPQDDLITEENADINMTRALSAMLVRVSRMGFGRVFTSMVQTRTGSTIRSELRRARFVSISDGDAK
jgi:hypothetical protein